MSANFPGHVRRAMLARAFAVQGSFNYRTLIGTGFAFVLLPALRYTYRDRPEELERAVQRHQGPFNSHPYLVGIAAGAVARLEEEGATPTVLERFKGALRGSLGSIGDSLFWAGLRPTCMLFALLLLAAGAPAWIAVLAFLLPYNAGHLMVRRWSFRKGFDYGAGVAAGLRETPLGRFANATGSAGAFLLGALLPLVAGGALTGSVTAVVSLAVAGAAAAGALAGSAVRVPVLAGLAVLLVVGLLRGGAS